MSNKHQNKHSIHDFIKDNEILLDFSKTAKVSRVTLFRK